MNTKPLILVVDDEVDITEIYAIYLGLHGFEVIAATDADSALEIVSGGGLDGMVTELFLAGASGLALATEVTRREPALRGRVLLVTDVRFATPPPNILLVHPPLRRGTVLEALGRRVRRP